MNPVFEHATVIIIGEPTTFADANGGWPSQEQILAAREAVRPFMDGIGYARWFKADGTWEDVLPVNYLNGFECEQLYQYVGDPKDGGRTLFDITSVRHTRHYIMVVHDEGKLIGLTPNLAASALHGDPDDYVAGNVLVCLDHLIK